MGTAFENDRLLQLLFARDDVGVADARLRLDGMAVEVTIGAACAGEPWAQAAAATVAACGSRMFRGGVFVRGVPALPTLLLGWRGVPLHRVLVRLGARVAGAAPPGALRVHIGRGGPATADMHVVADGWEAVASPVPVDDPGRGSNPLTGVAAAAIALSEAFRRLALRDPRAGRRRQGLNLWEPGSAHSPASGGLTRVPSALWLVGAGNLGQATMFALSMLPFSDPADVTLFIQDFERSGPENIDTQVMTDPSWLGRRKAAAAAERMAALGFETFAIERAFWPGHGPAASEPRVALVGVDNLDARRAVAGAGFDLVVDAGLGGTPAEIFDLAIRSFPNAAAPEAVWPPERPVGPGEVPDRYRSLVSAGLVDECGAMTIAGRQVGVPCTALVAAALQLAQLCRALATGSCCAEIDVRTAHCAGASATASNAAGLGVLPMLMAAA